MDLNFKHCQGGSVTEHSRSHDTESPTINKQREDKTSVQTGVLPMTAWPRTNLRTILPTVHLSPRPDAPPDLF
uniref:Uncharacterized protein n=1 Tax=Knipowitschia caucasica TaxID=637954 RepID=A0AAV2KX21_KNICA